MIACTLAAACGRIGFEPVGDGGGAAAAISLVQAQSNRASPSNALDVAFAMPPAAGNLVVAAVSTYDGAVTAITDTAGNTFRGLSFNPQVTSFGVHVYVFYVANIATANPYSVRVTTATGGTDDLSVAIHEYSGASALDRESGASGASASPDSGMVTTTRDGELFFGATGRDNTAVTSAGAGYTLREIATEDGGAFVPLVTEDKIGAAQTTSASFTESVNSTWACELATFR